MNYESLHNHTTLSDGTQTHLELLDSAEQAGYGVVAFTDHDVLPDATTVGQLRAYGGPVKWTIGIELTSGLPKSLGGGVASMFHVVGLFVDPTNQNLAEHCQKSLAARVERMKAIVANLRGLGFEVSADDCLSESGGESVGRPHIVAAILKKRENLAVIDGLKQMLAKESRSNAVAAVKHKAMLAMPVHQVPYALFLSQDAYISGIYVDYTYWTDLEASVALIREAGGVAILAHWFYSNQLFRETDLRAAASNRVIDGLEIGSGPKYFPEESTLLNQLAIDYDLVTTIGADAHRTQEMATFSHEWKEASVGQTKRLTERFQPDLRWSSL